jgi:hypothetical protein
MKGRPEHCLKNYHRFHSYLIAIWVFYFLLQKEGNNALYGGLLGYTVPQIRIMQHETRKCFCQDFLSPGPVLRERSISYNKEENKIKSESLQLSRYV